MRILAFLLCLITMSGYAQMNEINQLLMEKQQVVPEINGAFTPKNFFVQGQAFDRQFNLFANQGHAFETYDISIHIVNGVRLHVADYQDGTRVVTCLDGPMTGYQVVGVNGMITAESPIMKTRKNCFVHRYPAGKIKTYQNKQVIGFK